MTSRQSKLSHRTLSEGVEQIIRDMLLQQVLRHGERINEVQLGRQLGTSRGPIREALRRLQMEGLVVYHPHKGTYVSRLSKKDAEEIYTLRALLEAEAARLALRTLTPRDIDKLDSIVERFEQGRVEHDMQVLIQCDLDFHHIVVAASGHARLFEVYKTLDTQLGAMFLTVLNRAPARIDHVSEIHQELVTALRTQDERVVMKAFRDHYLTAWQAIAAVATDD